MIINSDIKFILKTPIAIQYFTLLLTIQNIYFVALYTLKYVDGPLCVQLVQILKMHVLLSSLSGDREVTPKPFYVKLKSKFSII